MNPKLPKIATILTPSTHYLSNFSENIQSTVSTKNLELIQLDYDQIRFNTFLENHSIRLAAAMGVPPSYFQDHGRNNGKNLKGVASLSIIGIERK